MQESKTWTSVKTKLPKLGKGVLCIYRKYGNEEPIITIGYYYGDGLWAESFEHKDISVFLWRPIPEIPKNL